jgi:RNA recognition motif-containing protein
MNIRISNLDNTADNMDLKGLFSPYGEVEGAEVMIDGFTGTSRGFGFVEMPDEAAAQTAVEKLNKTEFKGLVISVQPAPPKQVHKGSYKVGNGAVEVFRFRKDKK